MRVLLVGDYGTATGGAEIVLLELREELRRRGIETRLFASTAKQLDAPIEADATGPGTVTRWRTALQCANPGAALALRRELERFRPAVVHVRSYLTQLSPLVLPLLRGRPAVLHLLDYRQECPLGTRQLPDGRPCHHPAGGACVRTGCVPLQDRPVLGLQRRLDRRWRVAFDRVVANSAWVAERLRPFGVDVDEVVWNGVPISAAPARRAAAPTVTFAGRVVSAKGLDVLLRAFAVVVQDVQDARLVVAGDGPALPAARRLAGALELAERVTFLGHVDRSQLGERLGGAWVHAVPSTWEEPYGRSAAEALMRGQALVASDVGGLGELAATSGGAVVVPAGDVDALARALRELLTAPAEADRLGASGREFALRELSMERFADRLLDTYALARAAFESRP